MTNSCSSRPSLPIIHDHFHEVDVQLSIRSFRCLVLQLDFPSFSQPHPACIFPPAAPVVHHTPTLTGSFNNQTGIFYRIPKHSRLCTAQARKTCGTSRAKIPLPPLISPNEPISFLHSSAAANTPHANGGSSRLNIRIRKREEESAGLNKPKFKIPGAAYLILSSDASDSGSKSTFLASPSTLPIAFRPTRTLILIIPVMGVRAIARHVSAP